MSGGAGVMFALGFGLACYAWLGVAFLSGWGRRHPSWEIDPLWLFLFVAWPIVAAIESLMDKR